MNPNKFGAKKTALDGIVFDSKKEARRYADLNLLMHAGDILCLTLQPSYDIIVNGQKVCKVKLDFEYMRKDGKKIYEDVKGGNATRTPISRLKHKLLYACHTIEVTYT